MKESLLKNNSLKEIYLNELEMKNIDINYFMNIFQKELELVYKLICLCRKSRLNLSFIGNIYFSNNNEVDLKNDNFILKINYLKCFIDNFDFLFWNFSNFDFIFIFLLNNE
jgi:hypothetical protein